MVDARAHGGGAMVAGKVSAIGALMAGGVVQFIGMMQCNLARFAP